MTTVKNIYDYINSVAPFDTMEQWDNSGFLVGDFRKKVEKAVVTLDVTKAVAEYAESIGVDLIVSHHPIIFGGVKSVKKGSALYTAVNSDIAVVSAHTNFDMAKNGININLCKSLGLGDVQQIENSFVACGSLDCEMSIDDFAQYVADTLDVSGIRYTDTESPIKTVAVGGGACEEFAELALSYADCFLTGDMKYHQMLDFAEQGKAVISAGHFETESLPFKMFMEDLKKVFTDVEFIWGNQQNPVHTVF